MRTIKRYQFSILIAFIIVSTLYGIHMFRYEYVDVSFTGKGIYDTVQRHTSIIRVDRITNDACLYVWGDKYVSIYNGDKLKLCDL